MTDHPKLEEAAALAAKFSGCDAKRCARHRENFLEDDCGCRKFAAQILTFAVPQWAPIGSAPKDGIDILVYCASTKEQFVAYFSTGAWIFAHYRNGGAVACQPTHWMPLPTPQEPTKEGE